MLGKMGSLRVYKKKVENFLIFFKKSVDFMFLKWYHINVVTPMRVATTEL